MLKLETELRELLANKNDPKHLAQLFILLDSIKDLVATIEAEIDDNDNDDDLSDDDDDDLSNDYDDTINYDSDTSFTEEERKKINGPEHYAFLKRYSLVPK
jgi:hypothetical protein